MGFYKNAVFSICLGLILSNCAHPRKNNTLSFNQQQETMNANLPVVQGIRTINDVESVGFEWQPVGNRGSSMALRFTACKKTKFIGESPR